jgi:hypothetical protein
MRARPFAVFVRGFRRGASRDGRDLEKGAAALPENQPADRRRVIIG